MHYVISFIHIVLSMNVTHRVAKEKEIPENLGSIFVLKALRRSRGKMLQTLSLAQSGSAANQISFRPGGQANMLLSDMIILDIPSVQLDSIRVVEPRTIFSKKVVCIRSKDKGYLKDGRPVDNGQLSFVVVAEDPVVNFLGLTGLRLVSDLSQMSSEEFDNFLNVHDALKRDCTVDEPFQQYHVIAGAGKSNMRANYKSTYAGLGYRQAGSKQNLIRKRLHRKMENYASIGV